MKIISIFCVLLFLSSCAFNWSYEGKAGPQYWGDLKEDYKFCKIGYNQSPIDIDEEFLANNLKFSYSDSAVEKQKASHNLQIEFDSRDFVMRGNKKYLVRHFEFHHPSEHLVKGEQHSLELQIFHKSNDEQWLVVALFLEVGKDNPSFEQMLEVLQNKSDFGKIDFAKIIKEDDKMFFYDGSFTTPPCLEGVKWYVMKTPLQISKEQMNQIIKSTIFTKSNARPPQQFHPEKY